MSAPRHGRAPKVAIVAEFYPSQGDPVLGIWAHRQALAAREAGAEVRVLVLHRLVPPRASFADGPAGAASALGKLVREPRKQTHDGLEVAYVPYVSPPRSGSYASWGTWAAPCLAVALRRLRRSFAFDLIHAHNAVPAGEAVRRARHGPRAAGEVPLVVSVHGGDVLYTAAAPPTGSAAGATAVARGLGAARLVLANSQGIAELARAHGAGETRVVHLGADLPARPYSSRRTESPGRMGILGGPPPPTLVTVAHLVARKRHADVLRALAVLSQRHPTLRYEIIGEGPERVALEGLATRLEIAERVEFHGQMAPARAVAQARRCTLFVMPSTEEAFGVAYVEAMAGGLPAIGCRGEPGPEEIAAAGDGFMLVPPGDIERLSQRIDELLSDSHRLREASQRARDRCSQLHLGALRRADARRLRARAVAMSRPAATAASSLQRPVLFVTGHAPPDRIGAFARLHKLENVEFALFGGPSKHGGEAFAAERAGGFPFPHRNVRQHEPARLAASGRYRAVVCSSAGRVALGSTWAGTRRAGLALILWTSLWAHPRSPAHVLSFLALRRLYRSADAVVTYGPHVSAYVEARGARNVHVAPQAVDNSFWSARDIGPPRWPASADAGPGTESDRLNRYEQAATKFLFVGRPAREKGERVLTEAWRTTGLLAPPAALVLVGSRSNPPWVPAGGAAGSDAGGTLRIGPVSALQLRSLYAACDVLVVPSIATSTFREPWGLVVNEAMNRGLAVIASDAVGAVAGGLVHDGRNGLVVPAGDSDALAGAIRRLVADPALRARLGEAGTRDVRAYTYDAWAGGFSSALASLGLSRQHR